MIARAVLPWLMTWAPSILGCDGAALLYPEQVTYQVPYSVRGMVTSPACPLTLDGKMQACETVTGSGEWAVGQSTMLPYDAIPEPAVGEVYDLGEPEACNMDYGRQRCGPC